MTEGMHHGDAESTEERPMEDKASLPPEKRMEAVLANTFRGIHHCPKIIKYASRWEVNANGGLSTFDSDKLTRLVLAAHEWAVRVEIRSSGPGMVKIVLYPRVREGAWHERHPAIEQAVEMWRGERK